MLFRKFAIFAVVVSLLLSSCNYYRLDYEDRKNISILINEIYQNAINNNVDYFKPICDRSFVPFDEYISHFPEDALDKEFNMSRQYFDKPELNDREIYEFGRYTLLKSIHRNNELSFEELMDLDTTECAKSIIKKILIAKINKNYKRRMNLTDNKNIINFDYHWDEKDVHFQIYIEKNENGEWKALGILSCR